jgi:predicted membrane protein
MALFWAMSAGFIRGVGFVPRARVWRWLFSGWACAAALALAAALKLSH